MRARTSIDAGRLAAAMQRPGIDPREWVTRARVMELGYDAENGLFADVQFLPGGEIETCLIGTGYAGNGFGAYAPLKIGDIVLVAIPQGDPGEGPVIFSRIWTAADKPPPELAQGDSTGADEPTAAPTFRLENGNTLRIVARESGTIKLELSGNSTFELVATGGSKVVISADTTVEITGTAKVGISSDTAVVADASVVQIGGSALLGIARLTDIVAADVGGAAFLSAVSAAITAIGASATANGGLILPPAPVACAAVAAFLAPALTDLGVIFTASTKGLCE